MTYRLSTSTKFDKAFRKLDRQTHQIIKAWLMKRLYRCENPRLWGEALKGDNCSEWRYRIGDYRVLADIREDELVLICLHVGHRRELYD